MRVRVQPRSKRFAVVNKVPLLFIAALSQNGTFRTLVDPGDAPNRPVANRIVFEPLWRNLHVSHSLAQGATGFSDLDFLLLQDSWQFMDCRNSQITQPGRPLGTPDERKAVSRFDANPEARNGHKNATCVISNTTMSF